MMHRERATQRFRLQTEASRERDVYRHLHPWSHEFKCSALHRSVSTRYAGGGDGQPTIAIEAEPCPDTALTAFASLVCHRLATRRCYVTLVSTNAEHILTEASRSTSLQYDKVDDPKDRPWLGTCTILREEGMTSLAIDGWRRARSGREAPGDDGFYYTEGLSPHWHVISDIRAGDHAQHGVIGHSPRPIRFYAGVPLRAANGSVLGSLAIIDDEPRYGLSASELSFMEDISDTIVQHLQSVVVRSQRQRSERLIQSLGLFNSGKSSLRQWWLKQEDSRLATAGRHAKRQTIRQRKDTGRAEFGVQSSSSSTGASGVPHEELASASDSDSEMDEGDGDPVMSTDATLRNDIAGAARHQANISTQDFGTNTGRSGLPASPMGSTEKRRKLISKLKHEPNFDLEHQTKLTYARASNLMRQALGADGVVFLNANAAHTKKRNDSLPSLKHESSDTSSHSQPRGGSDNDMSSEGTSPNDTNCTIEGFSTREASSLHEAEHPYRFNISETILASLIRRYPQGRIFNFGRDGACYPSSGSDNATSGSNSETTNKNMRISKDGRRLGNVMAGAKTIAFYPLWDEAQDRWCSGVFVWCTTPLRYFDETEDITYLASWSHSIMAELGRLQTMASDKAKNSFISSISHELRSPLHAMLAGLEFLEETELTAFQGEMANTIRSAGRALLDTVEHILDFSKISSFTRAQTRRRQGVDALQYQSQASVDTAEIGVTATVNLALLTEEVVETVVNAHRFQKTRMESPEVPSVALNIGQRSNWMVKMQPGSWTRILSNLIGNSLKYTPTGVINIRLESRGSVPESTAIENVRLTVEDTGIGISKQFLRDEIYVPFKQANSHASGTGLGLSIAQRICRDGGAHLNIASELGVGTCATVDFQAHFVAETTATEPRGLNVDRFHLFTPTESNSFAVRSIAPSVIQAARDWLECDITQGPVCGDNSGSVVYAIAEEDLSAWASQGAQKLAHVLVLGQSMRSVTFETPAEELPFVPVFVHQPIGPQKLLRAITQDKSSTELASPRPRPEMASLLEYEVATAGRSFSRGHAAAGYFPGNRQPRVGSRQSAADPSTDQSTTTSASFSVAQASAQRSATTESSLSVDSTSSNRQPGEDLARDTVLLVEDNEVNLKLLMALMRKLKYKFICAMNGREAVDIYREYAPSILLVLMDISMPVMDGFAATIRIRETERRKKLPACHIAALTGVTSEEAKNQAFTSGVDEFYSKPVGMAEIRRLLSKLQDGDDPTS